MVHFFDRLDGFLDRRVPRVVRSPLRRLVYLPTDLSEAWGGRRPALMPPRGLRFVGAGDFERIGNEFKGHLVELCSLDPSHRILDVGCGIGRLAVPLTQFLGEGGSYEGFDVSRTGIRWCQRNITRSHPAFRFQWVRVRSGEYGAAGRSGAQFAFPYPAESFDRVAALSLFTHLLDEVAERYVGEIARVLRPGGCGLLTFFLAGEERQAVEGCGTPAYQFSFPLGQALVDDPQRPEAAVAYPESQVRVWCAAHGLKILEPIRFGSWDGKGEGLSFQDVLIVEKPVLEE